jgi:peptide deformylase
MPLRDIVTLPDPILRRKARTITRFDADLQSLIDDMIETMRDAPGVGLAAPQVGISRRLIVVEYPEDDELDESPKKLYVVVNPEIKETSDETEMGIEGCLSIPGLHGEVERAIAVTVKGQTRRGQPMKI